MVPTNSVGAICDRPVSTAQSPAATAPLRGAFFTFPLGGRCRADARRMRGQLRMKFSFAPQGDFCHQTKVTKSWFKNPWFLKISFSQALWSFPFNTGAEVIVTVSAIEPLSRFVRCLIYPVPVSSLRLHDRSLLDSPQGEPFLAFPLGGRCRADARRMRGRPWEILSAPQGDFYHQTKVTKSWFKNPWFLKISFP